MNIAHRNALIAIAMIGIVFLSGYYYTLSCKGNLSPQELSCSTAQKVLPFVDSIPLVIFVALVAGALVFYLITPRTNSATVNFNKATLKFLNNDEKTIIQRLVEKKGEALQSELTQLQGMTKVKSHRAIKKLEEKQVVTVVPKGKTNLIVLSEDIYRPD